MSGQRQIRIALVGLASAAVLLLFAAQWAYDHHEALIESRLDALQPLLIKHADRSDLPVAFLRAIVRAESGGDPRAISRKEARGLMQIRRAAEQDALDRLDVPRGDLFDPDYNILIGSTYLGLLRDRFGPHWLIVAAAYHMGPTRMRDLLNEYPNLPAAGLLEKHVNPTTRAYVDKVLTRGGLGP